MAILTATWTSQAPFYEYKLTGPDPDITLITSGVTFSTTVTISGLTSGESYTFWVRGVYGNGLYSYWSTMSGVPCIGLGCEISGVAILIPSPTPTPTPTPTPVLDCVISGSALYIPPLVLYGKSYNWYAANYNSGGETIAPAGWRLSTIADWTSLFSNYSGTSVPLKSAGHTGSTPVGLWLPASNPAMVGTNESEFNITPGGIIQWNGTYGADSTYADYWTEQSKAISVPYPSNHPLSGSTYNPGSYKNFGYNGNTMYESGSDYIKQMGFSIRLVKNDTSGYTMGSYGTMTDIDGNVYRTKMMDDGKVWMLENLRVSRYTLGTVIPVYTLDTQISRDAWRDTTSGGIGYYH
jgi:uncharacterized protein (TIGR02145 family)